MPNVTAAPKGLVNGEVVTEFTDTTGTASVTYSYAVQQSAISIENSGVADIFVTVGSYTNQVINPNKTWKADVDFSYFSIRSDVNSQEFIATTFQYDLDGSGATDSYVRMLALQGTKRMNPPSGLGYTPSFNVYRDRSGIYTDFDITRYQPTGKTYYVSPDGSDSNDGLTILTAFATFIKAYGMPDVSVILARFGMYYRGKGLSSLTISKNITIKAVGGPVISSAHVGSLSWSVAGGYTSTYQATRTTVDAVWDAKTLDASGDYSQLTKQTSIAAVDANPGSWYTDGSIVYVRTTDSRIPDTFVRVFLAEPHTVISSGNASVYFEGICFEGGIEPLKATNGNAATRPTVYAKNCKFKYGTQKNGTTIQGAVTFFEGCEASRNFLDGFNYHMYNNLLCTSHEINCTGRHNGKTAADDNNNGSTTHDGNTIVRVTGDYYGNKGPNVADVNSSKSWAVGCESHDTVGTSLLQNCNYYIDGTMWLDSCESYGSPLDLVSATSGGMYVRGASSPIQNINVGNGTFILPY